MPHISSINKKVLTRTFFPGRLWTAHKTCNLYQGRIHIHRHKIISGLLAEYINNAPTEICCHQANCGCAVACQIESHRWVHKSDTLKLLNNIIQLCMIGFQELATCRDIKEQVAHLEIGTYCTYTWLLIQYAPPFYLYACTQFRVKGTGLQRNLRHSNN